MADSSLTLAPLPNSLRQTRAAGAGPARGDVRRFVRPWVPVFARRCPGGAPMISGRQVGGMCDGAKVGRVAASADLTDVIDLEAVRDRADVGLVEQSMSASMTPSSRDLPRGIPVPVWLPGTSPDPAITGTVDFVFYPAGEHGISLTHYDNGGH